MKTISPKFRFILTVVIIKLTASIGCAQTLAAPEQTDDIINNSQAARRKLRQADILSVAELQNSDSDRLRRANAAKKQLQQAIEQIQTLKSPKPKTPTAADTRPAKPAQHTYAPQLPPFEMSKRHKQIATRKRSETQTPKAHHTDNTQRALTALMNNPQNVINPLAVAEALFQSGNLKDAAKFYKLALQRIADKTEHPDRPWAMFQAANCIRHDQPTQAHQLYQQLINEYPSSDFTAVAYSHQQVIKWYQQDKPEKILEKYSSDPNSL